MPYYSIRLRGGTRSEQIELRNTFNGREVDYTGTPTFFYVEKPYDIDTLMRNAQSAAGDGIEVDVQKISEREFNWRKYQNG